MFNAFEKWATSLRDEPFGHNTDRQTLISLRIRADQWIHNIPGRAADLILPEDTKEICKNVANDIQKLILFFFRH